MSENVSLLPIGVWSSFVGAQLGAAIIDWWKWWQHRRRALTNYEEVIRGGCVAGWRLAVSKSTICDTCSHPFRTYWMIPPWQTITSDPNTTGSPDGLSVLICLTHGTPDGRNVFVLRRQSLIADDVKSTLYRIVYSNEWMFTVGVHLTERVVAIVFEQVTTRHCRIIMIDTISKSHRTVTIEQPHPGEYEYICGLRQGTVERRSLEIIFAHVEEVGEDEEQRGEFIVAPYEITQSEDDSIVEKPFPWRSISFRLNDAAVGGVQMCGIVEHNPAMLILYYNRETVPLDSHRIFTLDEANGWRMDTVASWTSRLAATNYGAKLLAATESLNLLSLPNEGFRFFPPNVRHLDELSLHHAGGALCYMTNGDGVLQRSVNPPTLKRLAAEAVCRAKQPVDLPKLKEAIGFDIFDGMMDEESSNASASAISF